MYPQIGATVSHQFELAISDEIFKVNEYQIEPEKIVSRLSFSHLRELLVIKDDKERFFYETECIKLLWYNRMVTGRTKFLKSN